MSTSAIAPPGMAAQREWNPIVNDFSIQVATVNGSGSQSANLVLLRSLFQMGIPVSGKNLFPSNIAGLPTWYTIRTNKRGFVGRKKEIDVLVAMNPETAQDDVLELPPGTACVYDEPLKLNELRDDIVFYPVPFDEITAPVCPVPKLRKLVRNIVYDGILAYLLEIEMDEIHEALRRQFSAKPKAAELNWNAAKAGFDWASENLTKGDPYRVERMNENAGKIIVEGNAAAAMGAMFGGVTVVTWYPITPSSSLAENLTGYAERFRKQEDGKATFAIVQGEDELASVGMAIGAGWAGARSMTATSGPGISLMNEFIGLAYFAEIPVVIFDVQRMGPSTGLPTRTAQGDLLACALASHGDTKHPLLIPASTKEAFEFSTLAFDLAEQAQTPVFVMLDLDLGMNYWMSERFDYPEQPIARGKILTAEDLERLDGFARYKDVDGDGIPYRTLPGAKDMRAAYFTRGTGHNEKAGYSEKPADWVANMDRLTRKFETIREMMPEPELAEAEGAKIAFVGCGTSHWAIDESRDQLAKEYNTQISYLRLRAFPFPADLEDFIERYDRVYVVDQNRDGQLLTLIQMRVHTQAATRLRSIRYYGGLPLDARTVTDAVVLQEDL